MIRGGSETVIITFVLGNDEPTGVPLPINTKNLDIWSTLSLIWKYVYEQ